MNVDSAQSGLVLKLLSVSTMRAKVIAGNLSNQNTPGYTRKVVRFEDMLGKALDSGDPSIAVGIEPRIEDDLSVAPGADGNNVSMETEVNAMRENRLLYDLYASILSARMRMVESSITGGR
jgi:flagellar basal-body rod protein FlgB